MKLQDNQNHFSKPVFIYFDRWIVSYETCVFCIHVNAVKKFKRWLGEMGYTMNTLLTAIFIICSSLTN